MSAAMRHQEAIVSVENNAGVHEIRRGTLVRCQDGVIGRVVGLAPEWVDHPTHLVVQAGPLVPQEITLPLQWVAQVTPDQVVLRVRRRHLERALPRVTDDMLQAEVQEALYNTPQFRPDDAFRSIEVTAQDQVVTLRGNVRTTWRALLAEIIARQVRGVWDVRNELLGDDELADAVTQALRRERRLQIGALNVQSQLGQVTLRGHVRTAEDAALAQLVARRVGGVRSLANALVVRPPTEPTPAVQLDARALLTARRSPRVGAT